MRYIYITLITLTCCTSIYRASRVPVSLPNLQIKNYTKEELELYMNSHYIKKIPAGLSDHYFPPGIHRFMAQGKNRFHLQIELSLDKVREWTIEPSAYIIIRKPYIPEEVDEYKLFINNVFIKKLNRKDLQVRFEKIPLKPGLRDIRLNYKDIDYIIKNLFYAGEVFYWEIDY